jgi:hypothetical protein
MRHKDYSGTPLHKKLGIRDDSKLALVGAPSDFSTRVGAVPVGTRIVDPRSKGLDVIVLFSTSLADLERRFGKLTSRLAPSGGLWVGYPKRSSSIETDLNFTNVQQVGLGAGLVDNKSIAIDDDWSGVRFVFRLKDRPRV